MNIKGDITGGLTAGVVALPLCLAFGIASGLGAAAGLYGAIVLSFFAAVFGGTKTQISGPTGPMTVVTASVVVAVGSDMLRVCGSRFIPDPFWIFTFGPSNSLYPIFSNLRLYERCRSHYHTLAVSSHVGRGFSQGAG